MDKQRKRFLKMETTPDDNAVKTVEMTAKDLPQFIKIADEVAASSEKIDSNFERISIQVKWYQKALHATEKPLMKGRVNRCSKLPYCLSF